MNVQNGRIYISDNDVCATYDYEEYILVHIDRIEYAELEKYEYGYSAD